MKRCLEVIRFIVMIRNDFCLCIFICFERKKKDYRMYEELFFHASTNRTLPAIVFVEKSSFVMIRKSVNKNNMESIQGLFLTLFSMLIQFEFYFIA